jgi:hypothetical protein
MTNDELIRELEKLKVKAKYYSIGGELKDNAINVERLPNGEYAVYYLERGDKVGLRVFKSELEANTALYKRILFDIEQGLNLTI